MNGVTTLTCTLTDPYIILHKIILIFPYNKQLQNLTAAQCCSVGSENTEVCAEVQTTAVMVSAKGTYVTCLSNWIFPSGTSSTWMRREYSWWSLPYQWHLRILVWPFPHFLTISFPAVSQWHCLQIGKVLPICLPPDILLLGLWATLIPRLSHSSASCLKKS